MIRLGWHRKILAQCFRFSADASLQRLVTGAYGNDPTNWFGGTPTPGTNSAGGVPPSRPTGSGSTSGRRSSSTRKSFRRYSKKLDATFSYDYLHANWRSQAITFGGQWRFAPERALSPFAGAGLGFGKPYSGEGWDDETGDSPKESI